MMLLWRAHSLLPRRGLRLLERHVSSAPSAVDAQRLKGTTYNKKTGKWQAIITVDGKRSVLGSFDDVKQAADAYAAAKAVVKDQQYQTNRKKNGAGGEAATPAAPAPPPVELHPTFRGVMREVGVPLWEAVLRVEGGEDSKEISGGEYETPEEAARAYDALARMYLGADAPTNFPMNTYEAWVPPEAVLTTGQIETRVGEPLTVAEIETALRTERGEDIRVVPLAGRSDLADHMSEQRGRAARRADPAAVFSPLSRRLQFL